MIYLLREQQQIPTLSSTTLKFLISITYHIFNIYSRFSDYHSQLCISCGAGFRQPSSGGRTAYVTRFLLLIGCLRAEASLLAPVGSAPKMRMFQTTYNLAVRFITE